MPAAVLMLGAALAYAPHAAASPPLLWADFKPPLQSHSGAPVQTIALSEHGGDAKAEAVAVVEAAVQVAGRISKANGSQWATLGVEVAGSPAAAATNLADYRSLRIRLSSTRPRVLRIRLKGADPGVLRLGCYPVMMQQVGLQPTDYVIPLSAFEPEPYCAKRGVAVKDTLPAVVAVEVTANEPSDDLVRFAVGRIEFLRSGVAAPAAAAGRVVRDGDWTLAWSDEFDAPAGQGVDAGRWSLWSAVPPPSGGVRGTHAEAPKEAVHDGQGHLEIRARGAAGTPPRCQGAACTPLSIKLQARPACAMLFGRMEVRFKAPAVSGLGAQLSLLGAPLARLPWPDAGEIVLAETHGALPWATVGLHGPALEDDSQQAQVMLEPVAEGAAQGFRTVAVEWEPGRLRWLFDDVPVKTVALADLPATARDAFGQWPYLLQIGLTAGAEGAGALPVPLPPDASLLLDYVRVYQRAALAGVTRARLLAWQAQRAPAPAAARPREARPKPNAPPKVPPPQPMRQVVCERNNRYGLMMCY